MKRDLFNPFMSMPSFDIPVDLFGPVASPPNRTGPGKRSILTLHRKIEADEKRDTPGARRMRAVVARRRANWE